LGPRKRCRLLTISAGRASNQTSRRKHNGDRRLVVGDGAGRAGAAGFAGGIAVVAAADGDGTRIATRAIRRQQICHEARASPNQTKEAALRITNRWVVGTLLAALLVAAIWYCVAVWQATPSMPLYRNVILGGAAILMLVTGCGLIALMFYSRRKGYDEPARSNRMRRE
jgi:hypothetical protein